MVKLAALALIAMTATAFADDEYYDDASPPAFNMFGFRMTAGALPLDGDRTVVLSLGLGVEHPVFKKTRLFGEYEWLWLTHVDERVPTSDVMRPEEHGTGHRASFGLRRELVAKKVSHNVRLFIDGELGASVALVNDNMTGVAFLPGGLGGLRFGYDIYTGSEESPSRTFEVEILARAIAIEHGAGALIGIGMAWGN